jgi:hypothetical protein
MPAGQRFSMGSDDLLKTSTQLVRSIFSDKSRLLKKLGAQPREFLRSDGS